METLTPVPLPDTETRCAPALGRALLRVSGADHVAFLQGLVTQDLARVARDGVAYGALLSPQGKVLADFFLVQADGAILIDLAAGLADDLVKRLTLFKLRSKVVIEPVDLPVTRGTGPMPKGAFADPRDPSMGWRLYGHALTQGPEPDWDALRVAARVPETGIELRIGESYILELGYERLNGVDFRKGCYVGQEIIARMHHKTELRRRLMVVSLSQPVPVGTQVLTESGKDAGTVYTQAGGRGLAHLRVERAQGPLRAGDARLEVLDE